LICKSQRDAIRSWIAEDAGVVTGTARCGEELFKVICARQVARPHEEGNAFRSAESGAGIDKCVAVNIYISRWCRTRREFRAIIGVDRQEKLALAIQYLPGPRCEFATQRHSPLRNAGQNFTGDVFERFAASLFKGYRRFFEGHILTIGIRYGTEDQ